MAYTEFCCRSGGSNFNAGTLLGDSTEPGTSASYSYAGTFSGNTFTVSAGDPQGEGVTAGMFVHCSDGAAIGRIARITSVTSSTIVLSTTATAGSGTGATQAKVGGAWAGPSGSVSFPIGTVPIGMVNTSGYLPRINLKNDQSYLPTSTITASQSGVTTQGYGSSYGDGGRATIDAAGNTIAVLTSSASQFFEDLLIKDNGSSGTNAGINVTNGGFWARRLVVTGIRGAGIAGAWGFQSAMIECEVYDCNKSNTANSGGVVQSSSAPLAMLRCMVHDNTGGSNNGVVCNGNGGIDIDDSVIESNGNDGVMIIAAGVTMRRTDVYNNGRDGVEGTGVTAILDADNCNFIKNGRYGVEQASSPTRHFNLRSCGYGAGTMANTSGTTSGTAIQEAGAVTYPSNVTPWVDPDNGDFRVSLAQSLGVGRGSFVQTAASYAGTVGYPDIGAAQSAPRYPASRARLGM